MALRQLLIWRKSVRWLTLRTRVQQAASLNHTEQQKSTSGRRVPPAVKLECQLPTNDP